LPCSRGRGLWVEHAIRLGEVEATDEADAIEKAAEQFQQDPAKLIVVRRP
jgi:hypothetical protein